MAEYCEYCMQPVDGAGSCPFCGNSVCWNANDNWQLQPGTILQGRYLLGRVLGSGGFGVTYIGRDLRLNRRIAVKEYFPKACASRISVYSPVVTITDDQSYFAQKGKDSFIREAQALATLPRNLGVVEVYDFFEDNGTAYIVMEYLEGSTLKQLLQYRRFGADELFYLLEPVLEALELVHRSKLVHRDISPDNLMLCGDVLGGDGKLVLMDFGAARQVNLDNPLSMTLVVKRGYAPEEQYRTRGEVGPWTDIYALCATIYHCLTGIVPEESVERLVYDTIQWPSELGIAITQRQESVLKKGMAVHARDRYRSVGALRKALSGQGKAETVTSPVQPPVNRTMPEVNQMKSSWQQAGVHRMPETQTASETWEARPFVASAEAPRVSPMADFNQSYTTADSSEKTGKSGKLIALVAAVALVLCIGLVAVAFGIASTSGTGQRNGSDTQAETLNVTSAKDAVTETQQAAGYEGKDTTTADPQGNGNGLVSNEVAADDVTVMKAEDATAKNDTAKNDTIAYPYSAGGELGCFIKGDDADVIDRLLSSLSEKTGIHMNGNVVASAIYKENFFLSIASGDLPDIYFDGVEEYYPNTPEDALYEEVIIDIAGYIEDYAPDYLRWAEAHNVAIYEADGSVLGFYEADIGDGKTHAAYITTCCQDPVAAVVFLNYLYINK